MHRAILPLAALSILSAAAPSRSQVPAYKADEVVSKLLDSAELGAERGIICVGVQDCEKQRNKRPSGFDLVVTFELNSDELTDQAKANLAEFAKVIRDERLATAQFLVEGHTDATGPDTFNMRLSTKRAESVVKYLVSTGVELEKLKPVGLGEADPRSGDPYDPANRRVETRVEIK